MDGGDLKTLNRWHGGDLKTMSRQHGGIFGLLGKLFGLGPGELQKQMSDPIKQQMIMQRGGFPWALAGLSLLPALLGKGEEDRIRNQMKVTRDPIMQRGGLAIPPALISKGLPLLKQIGIPTAMGALASLGDNVVDKIFGDGKTTRATGVRRQRTKGIRRGIRKTKGVQRTKGQRKKGFKSKKATPRFKGKKQILKSLGNKLATTTGDQLKKFVKKKTRRSAQKALHNVGRQLFERKKLPLRLESMPAVKKDTPFTQRLRQSIQMAAPQVDSAHIGQTFNI